MENYTYPCYSTTYGSLSRIDVALGNEGMDNLVQEVEYLPRVLSDHCPLVVFLQLGEQGRLADPMEEDILQVVKYCTDLIEEKKDLEKLDLVIKYMKRLMQQSVESVWNMAFDFILDNVQVVLQQTYGSTLKVV
ncbi:unnamed protein product [Ranitomeya imitator]|uniref:DNA repair protein Rev1 C-terminal domain-containing protein n=1 Tax=Ranitomeya imitator TaxID=111125 RepID=A0ABN9M5R2_9NEOB|nr:unnamed protein product [Ranitomeya imitator]